MLTQKWFDRLNVAMLGLSFGMLCSLLADGIHPILNGVVLVVVTVLLVLRILD